MKTVAVVAICKDEVLNVPEFFEQVLQFDHVVILDTGSQDGTLELFHQLVDSRDVRAKFTLARRTFATIDYGAFRNAAQELLPDVDYFFTLDLDERIGDDFRAILDPYLEMDHPRIGIARIEHPGGYVTELSRICQSLPGVWSPALHEGWTFHDPMKNLPSPYMIRELSMDHYSDITEQKTSRYQELIADNLDKNPQHFLYFHLEQLYTSKNYQLFLSEYYARKPVVDTLMFTYRHLLSRFVLVSCRNLSLSLDKVALSFFMSIRNKSVLFNAARYLLGDGQTTRARRVFEDFLKCVDHPSTINISYLPNAYDPKIIQAFKERLCS